MDGDFENTWDALKARANTIKAQLEAKAGEAVTLDNQLKNSDHATLETKVPEVAEMKMDIDRGLKDLNLITEQLSRSAITAAQKSQKDRYRTIYLELAKECRRIKLSLDDHFARKQLFGQGKKGHRDGDEVESGLLGEGAAIGRTVQMTEEVIASARSNRDMLRSQRERFEAWGGKLGGITNMLPDVNKLIGKIGTKKRQENIVLGATVGVCIVFTIWWKFLS